MGISDRLEDIGSLERSLTPHMDIAKRTMELTDAKTAAKRAMPGSRGARFRLQKLFQEAYAFGQAAELDAGLRHGETAQLIVDAMADVMASLALSYSHEMPLGSRVALVDAMIEGFAKRAKAAIAMSDELTDEELTGVVGQAARAGRT